MTARVPSSWLTRREAGSNLAFGPGGQITIVSEHDNSPQPAVVSQNLIPQDVHSIAAQSQIVQSTASQPILTSALPQLTTTALLGSTTTPTGTSVSKSVSDPSLASSFSAVSISPPTLLSVSVVTSTSAISSSSVSSTSETPVIASSTTLASPESTLPSTSITAPAPSTGHGPSFYVGIVVGTIIIMACLAALVAWWVRMRSSARRRRLADDAAGVPWAKPGNSGSLEDGGSTTFIGSGILPGLCSLKANNSPDAMTWEPRGDRDVGEPKRTDSFLNASTSHTKRYETPYNPFATQYPISSDNAVVPLPLYNTYATMRLTSHLSSPGPNATGSVYNHADISSLGLLQVANRIPGDISVASSRSPSLLGVNNEPTEFGTPMESMDGSRPRFFGLEGGGLRVPWAETAGSSPRGMSFTNRRGGYWEHLPASGDSTGKNVENAEGWTASLKTNLMNAFNAVAAGLPSAPTMEERQENYFTPCPGRRGSRRTLHATDRNEMFANRLTRESTASSKPWTLEERFDGTGTVHFHGLEGYRGGDHVFSPLPAGSALTLQDGDRSDIGTSIFRVTTHESQTPLIVNKKPKPAVLRPGIYGRISQYGYGRKPGLASRASSVYSTASRTSSVYPYPSRRVPKAPRQTTLSRNTTVTTSGISSSSEGRQASERFVGKTRLNSTGCSFASYRSGGSMDEMDEGETMDKGMTAKRKISRRVV